MTVKNNSNNNYTIVKNTVGVKICCIILIIPINPVCHFYKYLFFSVNIEFVVH